MNSEDQSRYDRMLNETAEQINKEREMRAYEKGRRPRPQKFSYSERLKRHFQVQQLVKGKK